MPNQTVCQSEWLRGTPVRRSHSYYKTTFRFRVDPVPGISGKRWAGKGTLRHPRTNCSRTWAYADRADAFVMSKRSTRPIIVVDRLANCMPQSTGNGAVGPWRSNAPVMMKRRVGKSWGRTPCCGEAGRSQESSPSQAAALGEFGRLFLRFDWPGLIVTESGFSFANGAPDDCDVVAAPVAGAGPHPLFLS